MKQRTSWRDLFRPSTSFLAEAPQARRGWPRQARPRRWGATSPRSLYPRRVHPDAVDAAACRDVERLLVGVAEAHIGGYFRRPDRAEMLAFRRDDPHPARAGLVEIALGVAPQSLHDSRFCLPARVA